jgi:hypothetical protein
MTSLFEALAYDDQEQARACRKSAAAYSSRVEDRFGVFFRSASSRADFDNRVRYASDDLARMANEAVEEYGGYHPQTLYNSVIAGYQPEDTTGRTAATHDSARKPRMCPFHKDVVDISLSTGDPASGYKALESQWGGKRHCEGDGYEGESCKFKPDMTTKSYWENRAEKAQERRELREQQKAELDESQGFEEVDVDEVADSPTEPIQDSNETPAAEGAEVIDFPSSDGGDSAPEAAEAPMSMAASTATFQDPHLATETTGLGGPVPKMDKRKWTPTTVPALEGLDENTRHPSVRKDILEPIIDADDHSLKEIGEKGALEHQDVTKVREAEPAPDTSQWTEGPTTAVSSRQAADSITPRCPRCESATTGLVDDSQARCHACGNVWEPDGLVPVKASADPARNPIIDMMTTDPDGFVPDHVAARAILAHKRR